MNNPDQPIGIFDSGVGGISVLKHIHGRLPNETLLYVADSLYAPYGAKSADFIRHRALKLSEFLLGQGAKALVVACNTATAAAVSLLRASFQVPIIGMEPAVKPAAAATSSGVIGVLATSGTLKSAQFAALLESYGQHVQVVTRACNGLVECIERGELHTDSTRALLQQYLAPLLAAGADTIVLGCTHYPFVRPLIEALVGPGITLIDTGQAVAKHLEVRLQQNGVLSAKTGRGEVRFWTNSQDTAAADVIKQLWGSDVAAAPLPPAFNT